MEEKNHETINNEEEFTKVVEKHLQETFIRGMHIGAKTMCRTILNKLDAPKRTKAQKLADVKAFCKKALKNTVKE